MMALRAKCEHFVIVVLQALLAVALASCGGDKQTDTRPLVGESGDSLSRNSSMDGGSSSAALDQEAAVDKPFTVLIRDIVTLPASSKEKPLARINYLYHANDGTNRLFVNDMNGRIYVIKDDALLPEPFLDLRKMRAGAFTSEELFEQGLSGFAFHPDFNAQGSAGYGKVYTSSTEIPGSRAVDFQSPTGKAAHHGVVAEWSVRSDNPNAVDAASYREVLRIAHPRTDHVLGHIAFNPNSRQGDKDWGMLYIGVGDGGNTVGTTGRADSMGNGQNKSNPFGKILRINPLGRAGLKYSVPEDNPFVRDPNALKEIWAYGLRNPQRFSWDTGGAGTMFIADVGQRYVEEINIGKAGANYGWAEREGRNAVAASKYNIMDIPADDRRSGYTYPTIEYWHDVGDAVTGGFVYRGRAIPELRGKYVFGDTVSGRIFFSSVRPLNSNRPAEFYELRLRYYGREQTVRDMLNGHWRADLRFGMDQRGELYVLTKQDGKVRKLSTAVATEGKLSPVVSMRPGAQAAAK